MKPENKIPVLTRLSDEMTAVVNFQQPGLPPWPADGDIETQRQYYLLERRFWNADAPSMTTRTCARPYALWRCNNPALLAAADQPGHLILSARRRIYPR